MTSNKKKILVIDDVPENIYLLKERLEEEGFEIESSLDGRTGIQNAIANSPDLIICDIMMPEVDGFTVMNALKENPKTSSIPFIFLTAKTDYPSIRQGMKLGADDYITKPFTSQDLLSAINIRLRKKDQQEKRIESLRKSISYSLPHELQTPLTSILGFSEILIQDSLTLTKDEITEYATNIKESANRLNEIVQNILLTTKLDFIKRDYSYLIELRNNSTLITKKIIKDISIKIARKYNRESDLTINIESVAAKIFLPHFIKLMEEVIDNSFKFSNKKTPVQITCLIDKKEFVIYISDCGIGMTEDQISQIGEFMQFDRMQYERKGTGLGLSIVKKLLEIYCGKLEIKSVPSKQTVVSIKLPINENQFA